MLRLLTCTMMLFTAVFCIHPMDFGLRFNSHDFQSDYRTSFDVGDVYFSFDKDFKLGFYFDFYSDSMFGNIATIITDDGRLCSLVVSSMNDGTFKPALVIDNELRILDSPALTMHNDTENQIEITLNKAANTINLVFNNTDLDIPFDLSGTSSATFLFGLNKKKRLTDIAPINLRNVRVFTDGKNIHHWDLKYHSSPETVADELAGLNANITNPHWLIDDHADLRKIYSATFKENVQTAFDPKNELFYIVSDDKLLTLSPLTGDIKETPIKGGDRVMAYSNYMVYDTVSDALINYNLAGNRMLAFDSNTSRWNFTKSGPNEEPAHFNHAVAIDGHNMYAFGGYGFYKFNNDLYKLDFLTGEITECRPEHELPPTTSAAATVLNDTLYIFGGRGNESGRQELPSSYNYTLYAYDINTWSGGPVWKIDAVEKDFLPTQTMYYVKEDDCFYMGATQNGGQMIRISKSKPEYSVASTSLQDKMDYHDAVFNLYRSDDEKRYYFVMDKRTDNVTHEYSICTITAPFLRDEQLIINKNNNTLAEGQQQSSTAKYPYIIAVIAVIALAVVWVVRRNRHSNEAVTKQQDSFNNNPATESAEPSVSDSTETPGLPEEEPDYSIIMTGRPKESSHYFDRSHSSISLLGGFNVRDKDGNDITSKFTSRLKNLLVLLLLSCRKNESGIKYQIIDEQIWYDKDEKSAQNNRNVSMRKLRLLLEEVGNVSIVYDKGFFKIETNDVLFDYKEIDTRISEIANSENASQELINEILELLLMGPLLPNTHYDWLDKYKAEYSDAALTMLNKLLKYEQGKDDELAYRIADTISLHEPLSEEAMIAKCRILNNRGMIGMAKNIHMKFCREYLKSLGEEYSLDFASICKMNS